MINVAMSHDERNRMTRYIYSCLCFIIQVLQREKERSKKENMLHHFYNRVQRLTLRLANNQD